MPKRADPAAVTEDPIQALRALGPQATADPRLRLHEEQITANEAAQSAIEREEAELTARAARHMEEEAAQIAAGQDPGEIAELDARRPILQRRRMALRIERNKLGTAAAAARRVAFREAEERGVALCRGELLALDRTIAAFLAQLDRCVAAREAAESVLGPGRADDLVPTLPGQVRLRLGVLREQIARAVNHHPKWEI